MLLRFVLCLFAFIGALAVAGALIMSIMLMLRFPPLLITVVLASWLLSRFLKILRKHCPESNSASQRNLT